MLLRFVFYLCLVLVYFQFFSLCVDFHWQATIMGPVSVYEAISILYIVVSNGPLFCL